jgi:hypothetical protein
MFETPMTVVGRIITDPRRRVVGDQEVISFRMASNSRRRTAEGTWEPGSTLYITVNCWGKLVTGVGAGLYKGAPVIAVGTVHTSEYEDRDGGHPPSGPIWLGSSSGSSSLRSRTARTGRGPPRIPMRVRTSRRRATTPTPRRWPSRRERGGRAGVRPGAAVGRLGRRLG